MPYIKQNKRFDINDALESVNPTNPGELNYTITKLILSYMQDSKESYTKYNEIVGVLECCKLELYRRMISEYENEAKDKNGEVFYRDN